jgi:LysM repeat protein
VADLSVGESSQVEVWLDNVQPLSSVELHIGFDPRYLRVEDADPSTEGVQIGAGELLVPSQAVRNEADHSAGLITYRVEGTSHDPASGSGVVASFAVKALAEGGSPLSFRLADLRDPEGTLLSVPEQIDGLVIVGPGGTVEKSEAVDERGAVREPPVPPDDGVAVGDMTHIVQPGENLFRIALRYGTTVEAIATTNHLPNSHAVRAGRVLLIPAGQPASEAGPFTDGHYVVQPGDTLYAIAHRFDTTVEVLAALNGIAPPYAIKEGQVLTVIP